MRASCRIFALVIGLCAIAPEPLVPVVRAQSASEEDAARDAAQHHERGVRAFAAGRYRQAIELFRRADALKPSPAIAFNVGNAYEKLGDRTAAISAYREYLRRAPDAKDAREVERRIQALKRAQQRSSLQRMTIHSAPSGASLSIDGKPVGATPYVAELPEGLHTLELELPGHAPIARLLDVKPGGAEQVAFSLDAGTEPNAPHLAQPGPAPVFASAAPSADSAPRRAIERGGERTSTVGVLGWVAVGSAAAAFGGALTLEILRRAEQERARREQTQIGFHERVEAMKAQQTGARVLAVTGAALTAIGGTLLFVDASREEQRKDGPLAAGLAFTKDGASAMLRARY